MNEKHRKAVYASIWTFFMAIACYLTLTIIPSSGSTLSLESYTILAVEIILLAISVVILAVVLKLRKQVFETVGRPVSLAKIKKATLATLLAMLLATTTYATIWYLASFTSPPVKVERISGYFQFSNDTITWVDAYDYYRVENMSWYVRFNVTSNFQGRVNITWTLQYWDAPTSNFVDTDITVTTFNFELDGSGSQLVYASADGTPTNNRNWADQTGVWRKDLIDYEYFAIKIDFYQES